MITLGSARFLEPCFKLKSSVVLWTKTSKPQDRVPRLLIMFLEPFWELNLLAETLKQHDAPGLHQGSRTILWPKNNPDIRTLINVLWGFIYLSISIRILESSVKCIKEVHSEPSVYQDELQMQPKPSNKLITNAWWQTWWGFLWRVLCKEWQ